MGPSRCHLGFLPLDFAQGFLAQKLLSLWHILNTHNFSTVFLHTASLIVLLSRSSTLSMFFFFPVGWFFSPWRFLSILMRVISSTIFFPCVLWTKDVGRSQLQSQSIIFQVVVLLIQSLSFSCHGNNLMFNVVKNYLLAFWFLLGGRICQSSCSEYKPLQWVPRLWIGGGLWGSWI